MIRNLRMVRAALMLFGFAVAWGIGLSAGRDS